MQRKLKLTWQPGGDGRTGRWRKKYKGRSYYFPGGRGRSDRQAYQEATTEWEATKVRIDLDAPKPHQADYEQAIHDWEQVLTWCRVNGEDEISDHGTKQVNSLRKRLAGPSPPPLLVTDRFFEALRPPTITIPDSVLDADYRDTEFKLSVPAESQKSLSDYAAELDGSPWRIAMEIWRDRLDVQERKKAVAPDRSVHSNILVYLEQKENEANAQGLSKGRIYKLTLHLTHFADWLGRDTDVAEISGKSLTEYRQLLLKQVEAKTWSKTTASDRLSSIKTLVRWLWEVEAIPSLPRVLSSKSHTLDIGKSTSKIVTYSNDEIESLLHSASDRTRLYVLLMLNCGMTQKDISDLLVTEVDWERGRIIRKRSKTRESENVPEVNYLLWAETFSLLKQERVDDSVGAVLLNIHGGPLWIEDIDDDGKYRKIDNVKSAYDRLRRKTKINKPLKSLKKTSATHIRKEERFRGLEHLFLGHAESTVAHRHYAGASDNMLDESIRWLRSKYGLARIVSDLVGRD